MILLPALHTTFRFDDSVQYDLRSLLHAQDMTLASYVGEEVRRLGTTGRTHPLGILLLIFPIAFQDHPLAYKLYLVATALIAVAITLSVMVRSTGRRELLIAAGTVLVAALYQFRYYHDGLLGYSGVVQWSLLVFASSMWAWLEYERHGRRRHLVAAVALWTVCLLLYDANLGYLPVAAAMVAQTRRRLVPWARGVVAFAIPGVLAVATAFVLRATAESASGYGASTELGAIAKTYLVTVLSAVPMSYTILDPDRLQWGWSSIELLAGAWRGVVVATVVVIVAWRASRQPETRSDTYATVWIGVALWLTPSALIAVAPKYQQELQPGDAYITVLPQVLGVALLLLVASVAAIRAARRRGRRSGIAAGFVVWAAAAGMTATTATANFREVAIEQPTVRTRSLVHLALRAGLLDELPDDATVVGHNRDLNWYPYTFANNPEWFGGVALDRTGRRYDMRVDAALSGTCVRSHRWPHRTCEPAGPSGGWLAVRPIDGGGAAILATSPAGRVDDPAAPATDVRVLARGRLARDLSLVGTLPDGTPWSSDGAVRWRVVREAPDGGVVYEAVFAPGAPRPAASTLSVPYPSVDLVDPPLPPVRARNLGQEHLLP